MAGNTDTQPSSDGLIIDHLYYLSDNRTTQFVPRGHISYVAAEYKSNRGYLVVAAILALLGIYLLQSPMTSSNGVIVLVIAAVFVAAFFLTRRVGIVIGSSGGKMFLETRGRHRNALLDRIYSDLAGYYSGP